MALFSLTEKYELNSTVDRVFMHFADTDKIINSFSKQIKLQIIERASRRINQGSSLELQAQTFSRRFQLKLYFHAFAVNRHIAYTWNHWFFSSWEHDFYFESLTNQHCRVTECLLYRLPLGPIGTLGNQLFIRPYLQKIFRFHRDHMIHYFKTTSPSESVISPSASRIQKTDLSPPTRSQWGKWGKPSH